MFSETVPDPTSDVVAAGVRPIAPATTTRLISIGGGSPIDTAKAIGMIVANGGHPRDYKVPNPIPKAGPPHIAIPTTAGTGSEVTRFTVITDSERDEKMLIAGGGAAAVGGGRRLRADDDDAAAADRGYRHRLAHPRDRGLCQPQGQPVHRPLALAAMKTIWDELLDRLHEPSNRHARARP